MECFLSPQDWAAKRVGFAQADHSNDGEANTLGVGAIGSPEAGRGRQKVSLKQRRQCWVVTLARRAP